MIPAHRRAPSAPLLLQILGVVIGALIAAQVVTLALTLFFPPAPPQQHDLAEVAAALRGEVPRAGQGRPLVRTIETSPPSLQSAGWVVSPKTTADLARVVKAPAADVRLLFYSPPPLAGTNPPPLRGPRPMAARGEPRVVMAGFLLLAQAGPGGAPGGGGMGPGGMGPGGMGPGGMGGPPSGRLPAPDRSPASRSDRRTDPGPQPSTRSPSTRQTGPSTGQTPSPSPTSSPSPAPPAEGMQGPPAAPPSGPAPGGAGSQPLPEAGSAAPGGAAGPPPTAGAPPGPGQPGSAPASSPSGPLPPGAGQAGREVIAGPSPSALPSRGSAPRRTARTETAATPIEPFQGPASAEVSEIVRPTDPVLARPPALTVPGGGAAAPAAASRDAEGVPLAPPRPQAKLFGIAQAPQLEGEFVAALRLADGRWATVRPQPEGFPNSWQRRVLLWFALSLALIGPLAFLVARRLVKPLETFAAAAERLGREPSADLKPLSGPAEIGRAAAAFNVMQRRLKRYVEDRTGMVGAISHDLRTPLARMRFKLERISPAARASLSRDIDQMEEMITSVLSFMREDTLAAPRQNVDLRSLLEVVVDDAHGPVELLSGPPLLVQIDALGMQRVFENLIGNALKYGERARVSLRAVAEEAVVEIADGGPGLNPQDLEQVFKPFYRSAEAKASGKAGMGLGLSVSRSTVRAHGGELLLRNADPGLVAEVRLPLASMARIAA